MIPRLIFRQAWEILHGDKIQLNFCFIKIIPIRLILLLI